MLPPTQAPATAATTGRGGRGAPRACWCHREGAFPVLEGCRRVRFWLVGFRSPLKPFLAGGGAAGGVCRGLQAVALVACVRGMRSEAVWPPHVCTCSALIVYRGRGGSRMAGFERRVWAFWGQANALER